MLQGNPHAALQETPAEMSLPLLKSHSSDLIQEVPLLKSHSSDLIQEVAAHVPDLVVYGSLSNKTPYEEKCNGVLLYADISGFNELVEFMISTCLKRYGADQLTRTLNKYISEIVNRDSLLALWKVKRNQLSDVITLAVACAMNIQLYCGVWDTKVGVKLQIKIGISGGWLSKVLIGGSGKEYCLVLGRAVDEGRLAAGLAEYNVVILSPNAWELCDRDNILINKIENERAVKLRGIKKKSDFDLNVHIEQYSSHLPHEGYADALFRQASGLSANPELEVALRKYVMDIVLQKIDDGQPLEHLSEIRPVAVLLLNLQAKDNLKITELCRAIQDVCCGITELLQNYQGKINKVFMFNKGYTFLCVFGLPGDKHDDECAHALQCAFQMHIFCTKELLDIDMASISVTSGPVFFGVIGHPFRHDYTVIGRKVSLAASMTMHYPGLVSCDEDTYRNCKMPPYFFSELPSKVMKGVEKPGTIYEYLGNEKKTHSQDHFLQKKQQRQKFYLQVQQQMIGKSYLTIERNQNYPLLGREKEIKVFTKALNHFLNCEASLQLYCHRAVIYEGASGYGKSKILAEISYLAQKPVYKVVAFELVKMNREQPLYTLQTLMARLMQIDVCDDCIERKNILQQKFTEPENQEFFCLLNSFFQVKFPLSRTVSLMDPETRSKEGEKFLIKLLQQINTLNKYAPMKLEQKFKANDQCQKEESEVEKTSTKIGIRSTSLLASGAALDTGDTFSIMGIILYRSPMEMVKFIPFSLETENDSRAETLDIIQFDAHPLPKEAMTVPVDRILKQAMEKEALLCIIDQAHYIDMDSWNFLSEIFDILPVFLVMALSPFPPAQPMCTSAMKLMKNEKTFYVYLNELKPSVISELACQILGVISIPIELEILLIERSYGIPYYCKELLKTLAVNKIIELYPVEKEVEMEVFLSSQKPLKSSSTSKLCKRHAKSHKSLMKREPRKSRKVTPVATESVEEAGSYSCHLRKDANLQNIPLPLTLRGIALSQLDQMSPEEQLVVKCAAVIGQTFTIKLLYHIFPDDSERKLAPTLMSLVKMQMIECASRRKALSTLTAAQPDPIRSKICFCAFTASEEQEAEVDSVEESEKTWPCKVMHFCNPLLQEIACELWTGKNLKALEATLHLKCASILENYAHKCNSCGGDDFIFGHNLVVDMLPTGSDFSIWDLEDIISENASMWSTETAVQMIQPAEKGKTV
ncbi:adenylate cyclase type 10-like [Microcaecilia unicolor]|uniref:Adenylate cyclase type 10-like n=1 Tax=Microcaecilia unicolor TaxID=1415580 RepID=A0A6P7XSC9_9AMPH|nr:adenylate cyclase type 10-like [Microcaecilia unicolor]